MCLTYLKTRHIFSRRSLYALAIASLIHADAAVASNLNTVELNLPDPMFTNLFFHRHALDLSLGLGFSSLSGNTENLAMTSTVTNTYVQNSTTRTAFVAGVSYQYRLRKWDNIILSLGPGLYYGNLNKVAGVESPFSNAGNFDQLNYQYHSHVLSAFYETYLSFRSRRWEPFVLVGVGGSQNTLSSYQETPVDPNGSAAPAQSVFRNNSRISLSYEAGFGVSYILSSEIRGHRYYEVSAAYRYMNFGSGRLLPSSLQTTGEVLHLADMDTHAILISIRSIF